METREWLILGLGAVAIAGILFLYQRDIERSHEEWGEVQRAFVERIREVGERQRQQEASE